MKKFISLILVLILTSILSTTIFAAQTANGVILNGKELSLDVKPAIDNGRTLVPVRAIFESLGFNIEWNNDTRQVIATRGSDEMVLTIDEQWENSYNNVRVSLDVPAKIINKRTLVPVRIVSELLGLDVKWSNSTRKVIINNTNNNFPVSLELAQNILIDSYIDYDQSLLYEPLTSAASHDPELVKSYYIFSVLNDYGYGLEIEGGFHYLVDKKTGEVYDYNSMTS